MKRLFYFLLVLAIIIPSGFASSEPTEEPVEVSPEFVIYEAEEPEAIIEEVQEEPEDIEEEEPVEAFDEPEIYVEEESNQVIEEPEEVPESVILYEEDEFGQVWEIVVDNPEGIITEPEDYEVVNAGIEPGFSYGGLYAQAFTVVSVERDSNDYDEVQIMDGNGFIFVFYSYGSDWCVGDGCACVMDMNGTPEIFDDIILSARYFA